MDADESLTALKKAYADIILNTAKEAAARIMVSERKALRFEHELNVTKGQGLQTLLRLKQMMDSKVSEAGMAYLSQQREIEDLKAQLRKAEDTISEADTTSLIQRRKIEELEAQLHEAEDIVKDLREELREVQAEIELGRVRNSLTTQRQLQHRDEHDLATQQHTSQGNSSNTSQSIIFPPPESQLESFKASHMKNSAVNQRNEVYKGYNVNDSCFRNSYIGKPDLPSTSENRLNTSQSIIFPPPESRLESYKNSDMTNSAFNQRNEVYKCYSANNFHMGNSYVSKPDLPSIILGSKEPEPYRNRRTQRIRAFEEKLMAGELSFSETIEDVNYETSAREDGGGEGLCKTPNDKADSVYSTEKKDAVQVGSDCYQHQKVVASFRCQRRAYKRHLSNQALKRDQTSFSFGIEANSINNIAQSGRDPSKIAPSLSADTTDKGTPVGCTKVTESDVEFVKAVSVENTTNKDKASMDKLLQTRQESGSADSSGVPICRMDVEKVDVPGELSFSETIEDVNCETSGRQDGGAKGLCKTPTVKADNMCSTEKKDAVQAGSDCYQHQKVVPAFRRKRRAYRRHLTNQALKRGQTSVLFVMEANSVNSIAQSVRDHSKIAPRLSADTPDEGTPVGCTKVTERDVEFVKAVSVENTTKKDEASMDKLLQPRQESGSADSSGVPICRMDIEKVDVPVINSQTKTSGTTNGIPNQPTSDRVFKYTFQRKRKKDSLSNSDGNTSLEKSILKKKATEKQNGLPDMEKSSSITESSRGSRRLAQVARQLISLSGKKW